MFERVIAYPDGTVIFHYADRVVTYSKDERRVEKVKTYNKREFYEFLDGHSVICNNITSPGRDELSNDIPTLH